jgi:LPXTG-site transpeptidase (sortase) family protein
MRQHDSTSRSSMQRQRVAAVRWNIVLAGALIAILLGISGGVALSHFAPTSLSNFMHGFHQPAVSERSSATPIPLTPTPPDNPIAYLQQFVTTMHSYTEVPSDHLTGLHLVIPKLNIDAPIVERGIEQGWMVVAPGNYVTHFAFSAYPGAIGNSIMYGHDGSVFRHLDNIAVNDPIEIHTPTGTILFRVRELRIVSPNDLGVLDSSTTPVLTILTCYPYGVDSSRLVVIADLVK